MADTLSRIKRSWNMSRIRPKNTGPEKAVRAALHREGYKFRLHHKELPGKPDIVLPKHKTVIFVHGCFWHRHKGCKDAGIPKSNTLFWRTKLNANVERDKKNKAAIKRRGWKVIIVWECETNKSAKLSGRLIACLRRKTAIRKYHSESA